MEKHHQKYKGLSGSGNTENRRHKDTSPKQQAAATANTDKTRLHYDGNIRMTLLNPFIVVAIC
jgi:hypothetical protein